MFTLLTAMSLVVLAIHISRRDWSSPSVYAATAVLAVGLGGHPGLVAAEDALAVEEVSSDLTDAAAQTAPANSADFELEAEAVESPGDRDRLNLVESSAEPVKDVASVRYPDRNSDSPAWLTDETALPDSEVEWTVVHADVEPRKHQAREALDREIVAEARAYLNRAIRTKHAARHVKYSITELREHGVIEDEVIELAIIDSLARKPWYHAHALLKFDETFAADVTKRAREASAKLRLQQTGAAAAFGFLLLGTVVGYFKLDTATRGYYTARLQFATAGTILAVVAVGVLAAKMWVPGM